MSVFDKDLIFLDVGLGDKDSVLSFVVDNLYSNGVISDKEKFLEDVLDRENVMSTYIGKGIAIPHAKSDSVLDSTVCLVRLKEDSEFVWNEDSGEKVRVIILLAVENGCNNLHLKIISKLARSLMHDDFVNNLLNSNLETLYQLLNGLEI